jgi:hypothetical protein
MLKYFLLKLTDMLYRKQVWSPKPQRQSMMSPAQPKACLQSYDSQSKEQLALENQKLRAEVEELKTLIVNMCANG